MEEVDRISIRWYIEVVKVSEELGRAFLDSIHEPTRKASRGKVRRFQIYWFKHFERRREVVPLLIEDQCAVFHPPSGEEPNVASTRQLLRGTARRLRSGGDGTMWGTYRVKMVSYE